jgi:uncharacterized membrane protein
MWVSMALLLSGLLWYAIAPSSSGVTLGPVEAIDAILSGDPIGLIDLGILFLIATPLLRIVTALAVFAQTREWKFVLVSVCVLLIITLAVFVKG